MSVITIRHDHYHYDGNKEILDEILKAVLNNQLNIKTIMTDLTALEAEVAETKTVVESAVVLIDGLRQAIIDAGTDPVKLKALTDSLDAENKKLADKVAENTTAEEETPQ